MYYSISILNITTLWSWIWSKVVILDNLLGITFIPEHPSLVKENTKKYLTVKLMHTWEALPRAWDSTFSFKLELFPQTPALHGVNLWKHPLTIKQQCNAKNYLTFLRLITWFPAALCVSPLLNMELPRTGVHKTLDPVHWYSLWALSQIHSHSYSYDGV